MQKKAIPNLKLDHLALSPFYRRERKVIFAIVFLTDVQLQYKLSRGEICVANLEALLRMVRVWTGFCLRVTKSQSDRVTDTQGYSVYGWATFFVPYFNTLPFLLCSQGNNRNSVSHPIIYVGPGRVAF